MERLAAVAAARVSLVNRHLRAIEHGRAERNILMLIDRAQETDGDFGNIRRLQCGHVGGGAVVIRRLGVVLVIGPSELGKRLQIVGSVGVGFCAAALRRARRIRAAGAGAGLRPPERTRQQDRQNHGRKAAAAKAASRAGRQPAPHSRRNHLLTPSVSERTLRSLQSRSAIRGGIEWPGCRSRPAAGRDPARGKMPCALR